MQNTTCMDKCMHSFNRKYALCNSENLIPKYFQQRSNSIDLKGYSRPVLEIKHTTWTYDPKSDPKKKHTGYLD